jgi:hypothetical protein
MWLPACQATWRKAVRLASGDYLVPLVSRKVALELVATGQKWRQGYRDMHA